MATVGVVGAGTMGAGIAQVALTHGWSARLMDLDASVARKSAEGIGKRLDRLVEKGKLDAAARRGLDAKLITGDKPDMMADCDLIIEAVVEDLGAKVEVFKSLLPVIGKDCLLATNTSSLSVTEMGEALGESARIVGMHFFNPVPLMPLVEVVTGSPDSAAADRVARVAADWGKTVVRCKDTPGFIVNRVARGFYLESLRLLGEGVAGIDEIDAIMKNVGGFRMGPFELMDLVGIDVNYTVTCSVFQQMGEPARLAPHPIQEDLFRNHRLGRKSSRGFYSYESEVRVPAVIVERKSFDISAPVKSAVESFARSAAKATASLTERYVFARVLVAIINEAALALDQQVASRSDIDTAMKKGTNYPQGPLEWADEIGLDACLSLLDALNEESGDGRFTAAALLRR
ncbi:MAG: 3-hydroxybutyryl-CoA dehydrogenase [Planctomycetes bacterium]|nr:3-hydroxybutyryl-CoA dehydrogenase [Planctomycetota bacterium]